MLSASPASALRIVVVLVAVAGCKPGRTAVTAPDESEVPDDIAQIEAKLARNADDLQAAGIVVVARRTEAEPGADAPATPEASDPVEAEEPPAAGEEEGDAPATEPEPTTAPEPAPPPTVEADRDDAPLRRGRVRRFDGRRDARRQDDRCQRICDLAEATCDLADRICGLATRHPDEVRYEMACERAEDQCDSAAEACNACAL